jgi:Tol biopolymer transport system component
MQKMADKADSVEVNVADPTEKEIVDRYSLTRSPMPLVLAFAPNGAMVILAGRERGQGVLQTVSIDGQTSLRLNADAGEVREPVWGPFLP